MAEFLLDAPRRIQGLRNELLSRTYQPSAPRVFTIREPKPRVICALPFRDRVVQHALIDSMLPSIERELRNASFACRRGFGTHRALGRAVHLARTHRFVLVMDVRKFFPTIDHELLLRRIRRHAATRLQGWLVGRVLSTRDGVEPVTFHFPGDDLLSPTLRPHGLPIGNLTSQVWANLHAAPIDHALVAHLGVRCWVRYSDDLWVFGNDADMLRKIRAFVERGTSRLRLRLHATKTHVQPTLAPFRCLGFSVRRIGHSVVVRLRGESVRRFEHRLERLRSAGCGNEVLAQRLAAWAAHAGHGHTRSLRAALVRGHTATSTVWRGRAF